MIPVAPLVPFALRWGARMLLVAGAGWVANRAIQHRGSPSKTLAALRDDAVHTFRFVTDEHYRKLKRTAENLTEKGTDYTNLAGLVLSLAEAVSGAELSTTRTVLQRAQDILTAYNALDSFRKEQVDEAADENLESQINSALQGMLYSKGITLINATKAPEQDTAAYLEQTYRGLYYIGRSGRKLGAEELDSRAQGYRSLHESVDTSESKALAAWYSTVGEHAPAPVLPFLRSYAKASDFPEADMHYVAAALGQPPEDLDFSGVLEEVLSWQQ